MKRTTPVHRHTGWLPLRGSWEEAVLTWNEQVQASFRRKRADSRSLPLSRPALPDRPLTAAGRASAGIRV